MNNSGLANSSETKFTFDVIADEMILNAWNTVLKYHIHLGNLRMDGSSEDALESIILTLFKYSNQGYKITKREIKVKIKEYSTIIKKDKEILLTMVPYRLLKPFVESKYKNYDLKRLLNNSKRATAYFEIRNQEILLPYLIHLGSDISSNSIEVSKEWATMMRENYVIIMDWIQYNKALYLQQKNPSVPGIVYKISDYEESPRYMGDARKMWLYALTHSGEAIANDIYSNLKLETDFALDHYIPRNFVESDELWNLIPANKSVNSSKNDGIPDWNKYYHGFSKMQFTLYQSINTCEYSRNLFEKCRKHNLSEPWSVQLLYVDGNTYPGFDQILSEHLKPIYNAALLQGFSRWSYTPILKDNKS